MTYAQLPTEPGDEATLRAEQIDPVHKRIISADDTTPSTDKRDPHAKSSTGHDDAGHAADMDLPTRIRAGRRRVHLSQADLAKRLGMRQSAISQWETGRTTPDIDNRIRLSDILKIPLPDLLPEAGVVPANLLSDPIILRLVEQFAQLPPQWQATVQLLVSHLLETIQKSR